MVKNQMTKGGLGRVKEFMDGNGRIDYARFQKKQSEERIEKALKKEVRASTRKK